MKGRGTLEAPKAKYSAMYLVCHTPSKAHLFRNHPQINTRKYKQMNKERLFAYLETQEKKLLLTLLDEAYREMEPDARHRVFGKHEENAPLLPVNGDVLLSDIESFQRMSLSGYYYEPFSINSRNFSEVPRETEEWFEEMGEYLKSATQLSNQGDHMAAVLCFEILYGLIEKFESGEEIVFGREVDTWMIPGDDKLPMRAYVTSLAKISTPAAFTDAIIPLIKGGSGLSLKVYDMACKLANDAQKEALTAEVTRKKIRTKSRW